MSQNFGGRGSHGLVLRQRLVALIQLSSIQESSSAVSIHTMMLFIE